MVKVKDIKPANSECTLFLVTIAKGDRVYEFVIDDWELLDKDRFLEILKDWEHKILPMKSNVEKKTMQEKLEMASKYIGLEVV